MTILNSSAAKRRGLLGEPRNREADQGDPRGEAHELRHMVPVKAAELYSRMGPG
jgi:hypothetical protein